MQELHAVNNGDGTYTVQVIAKFREGFRQYVTNNAHIKMDCVVDEIPTRQPVHVHFGDGMGMPDFDF